MLNLIIFISFSLIFFFFPGLFFLKISKIKLDKLSTLVLSFILGICLFLYVSLFLRFLPLPYEIIMNIIYLPLSIVVAYKVIKNYRLNLLLLLKKYYLTIFIYLFSIVSLGSMHFGSGFKNGRLLVSSGGDALWRISIIQQLVNHFPPLHPGFSGELLKNYHFLYDFLIASSHRLTNISVFELYYVYFTLISASIFVVAIYLLLGKFTKNYYFRNLGTFFTVFTGNLSFLLPIFSSKYHFLVNPGIFMSDQPFDQAFNQFNLFSYGLFLIVIYLFYLWEDKRSFKFLLLFGLVLGILPGVKIYGGIILLGSLALVIARLAVKKEKKVFLFTLPYLLFTPFYLLIKGNSMTRIIFAPFWLLDKMILESDRLNIPELILKQQYYQETGNYLRLIQYRIEQLLIYFIGNLNIRLLALPWIFSKIKKLAKISFSEQFLIAALFISFIIPLSFIQSRGVYDIIQFAPYGFIILSIISVPVLEKVYFKMVSRIGESVSFLIVLLLVLSGIFTNLSLTYTRGFIGQKIIIEKNEVAALEYLHYHSNIDDIILSDLFGNRDKLMYISAISGRGIFLGNPDIVNNTGVDPSDRKKLIDDYLKNNMCTDLSKLTTKYNISYIYFSNESIGAAVGLENSIYKKSYDKDNVVIYKAP